MLSQEEFPALSAQKQTSRQEQHVTRTTATTQRTNILTPDQADHLVSGITGHRLGNAAVGEGLVQVAVPPGETVAVSGSIEGQPIARTVVASQTALPVREMVIVGQTEEIVPATVVKKTTILAETQRIPTQTLVRQEVDRTSTLTETTKEISKEAVEIASKTAGMAIDATEAAASTVYNKTTEAGAFVRDTAASAAETAKETIKEGAEVVAEKAHDLTLGTAEMIGTGVGHVANVTEAAAEKAVNAAETVAEGTAEIVGGGAGLIVNTATGTAELAKDATLGAVHLVEGAAETLYDAGAAVANKAKEEFEAAEEIAHNIVIGTAEKIGAGAGHVANVAEAVTDTAYNVVTGTAELAKDVTLGAAHLTKDVTVGTVHLAENAVVGTAHLAKDVTVGTATLAKDITVGTVQKTAQVAGAGAGFLVNTATSIASTAAHVVTGTVSTVVGAASTAVEMAGDGASAVVQGVVGLGEAAKEKILSPAAEVIAKEEKIVEEKIAEDYSVYESVMKIEGKEIHKTEKKEKDIGIDLANPEGVVLTQGVRWSNLAVAEPPVTTVERVPAEIITERTTFIPPTGEIVTEKVGQITTGFTGLGPATVISSHTIPLTTERIEPDVEPQIIQQSFTGLAGQPQDQGITNLTSQVTAGTLAQGVITRDSFGQGQRVEQLRSEQEIVTGKNPVNGLPKTFSGALKEGLEEMPPVANLEEKSFATAVKEPILQARNIHLEKKPLEADFLRGREEVRNMTALQTSRGGEDIYGYAPAHEAEHYAIENKDKIHESHPRAFEGEGHMPGYCPKGPSMTAPREKTWIASVQRDTSPKSGTGYITDESESAAEADSKWLDEGGASTELSDRLHGSELINKEERARHDSLMSDASWTTDTDFRDRTGSTKSALSFGSPIKEHMKTVDSDDEGIREEHEITSLDADLVMNIFPKSGEKAVLPIDNTIGKEAIPFEPVGPEGKIGAAPLPELV